MLSKLRSAIDLLPDKDRTRDFDKIQRNLYRLMPDRPDEFVKLCDEIMDWNQWPTFWLVTMWVKRHGNLYRRKYFDTYNKWLYDYTDGWGKCDILCYRVLNPMIERFPQLREIVFKWATSSKTYVRRAAAASLLKSGRSFDVNVEFETVKKVCDLLKNDHEIHVQKGIGWLLKYTYLTYPEDTVDYLENNVNELSRTTFRYALEKMPVDLKSEFMSL